MSYHIAINGQQSGPHTEEEIDALRSGGELKAADLCWRKGWPDWRPVAEVFGGSVPPPASHAPAPALPADDAAQEGKAGPDAATPETIRREHLKHEAAIRSIGSLYCIAGVLFSLMFLGGLIASVFGDDEARQRVASVIFTLIFGLLAALQFWIGIGLRRLNPRVAVGAAVFAVIGLLGFPVGTLIGAYVFYLLFGQKGKVVLGPGYREIVAATPHIPCKAHVWVLVVGVLLALGLIAAIVIGAN